MDRKPTVSLTASVEQGLLSILDTGLPIFLVNLAGEVLPAIKAGLYQSALTFCLVVINTLIFQYYYRKQKRWVAVALPVMISTGLAFTMHTLAGSPQPFYSACVVFLLAAGFYTTLGYFSKRFGTISVIGLARMFCQKAVSFIKPCSQRF